MQNSADSLLKIELLAVPYCLKEKWSSSQNNRPDNHNDKSLKCYYMYIDFYTHEE